MQDSYSGREGELKTADWRPLLPRKFRVGTVSFSGRTEQPVRLSIAPMVDVSDRDFRTFMRLLSSKCEVWTEMLVDQALVHNEEASQHLEQLIGFSAPEHPIVCQLGGHDPTKLAAAARIAHLRGYDEVNLNVGCPSSRVAGHGLMGVALMKTPELVRDCLRALENEVSRGWYYHHGRSEWEVEAVTAAREASVYTAASDGLVCREWAREVDQLFHSSYICRS